MQLDRKGTTNTATIKKQPHFGLFPFIAILSTYLFGYAFTLNLRNAVHQKAAYGCSCEPL